MVLIKTREVLNLLQIVNTLVADFKYSINWMVFLFNFSNCTTMFCFINL